MSWLSAGLGVASALGGLFGGGGAGYQGPSPQSVQLPRVGNAANDFLAGNENLGQYNLAGQLLPQYQQLADQYGANPYGAQATAGAQTGSGYGMDAAARGAGDSASLSGFSSSLIPYASQIGQTAFDPQNALYARSLAETQAQQRAGQSARGVAMSPYGASLENKALSDFNIDWQNQQLDRQTQGASAMGGLLGNVGSGYGQALQLGQNASQLAGQAGAMPYDAYQAQGQNQLGWLNALSGAGTQAAQIPQQQIANYGSYIGMGNAANNTAIGAARGQMAGQQQGFQQDQTLGSNLGSSLSSFGPYGQNAGFFTNIGNLFKTPTAA